MLFVKVSEDFDLKRMHSDLERAKVQHLLSLNLNVWLSLLVSPFMEMSQNCLESSSLILINHLSSKATSSKTAKKSRRM
ncbi:hypothetical protein AQUCO_06300040v1 [Aquilegia coerulea]|uniref:Uncharacterized protein n=1 Tax=Aquilegia coerulea TaxID=218851 RepID=A0A2G5CCR0_AQUCA|nr:hypothetical protein AQUCO_06300040v1 [Aquilegia coerulea]